MQKLYSVLFKQRYYRMLLSYHQFLLERDVSLLPILNVQGYVDLSVSTADYLMTSAVMEKKVQFAQSVWGSIPEAWRRMPRMYCGIGSLT